MGIAMTTYYIGRSNVQGVVDEQPTINTSAQGKDVEVAINGANVPDKETAMVLLESLQYVIAAGTWPPM